jgi:hypothetical protein
MELLNKSSLDILGQGKIKELCNLREVGNSKIKLF